MLAEKQKLEQGEVTDDQALADTKRLFATRYRQRCGYTETLELDDGPPPPIEQSDREQQWLKTVVSLLDLPEGMQTDPGEEKTSSTDDSRPAIKLLKLSLP